MGIKRARCFIQLYWFEIRIYFHLEKEAILQFTGYGLICQNNCNFTGYGLMRQNNCNFFGEQIKIPRKLVEKKIRLVSWKQKPVTRSGKRRSEVAPGWMKIMFQREGSFVNREHRGVTHISGVPLLVPDPRGDHTKNSIGLSKIWKPDRDPGAYHLKFSTTPRIMIFYQK